MKQYNQSETHTPWWVASIDAQGRILRLGRNVTHRDDIGGGGHSACNKCNKDMPYWDTVCTICRRTFCYDHSKVLRGHWFCEACYENEKRTVDQCVGHFGVSTK